MLTAGKTATKGPLPTCYSFTTLTAANLAVKPDSSNVSGYTSNNNISVDSQFFSYASTPLTGDDKNATVLLPGTSSSQGTGRYVLGPAALTGTGVKSASAQLVDNQWIISLVLTATGDTAWEALARKQFHAIIGIDLDGKVISTEITQPLQRSFTPYHGVVQIADSFTKQEAQAWAAEMQVGVRTTTPPSTESWTGPQITITPQSLGAVQVGMTVDQAQAAAGVTFDGLGDGMFYPTTTPDHVYAGFLNSTPTVSCVGAALGQSSGTQTVSTPEGFQLGGSVASLLTIYGSHAAYVPAPNGGIRPVAGYIVAEAGGNLFFYIDQTNATVPQIAGGPNVSDGNSCSG